LLKYAKGCLGMNHRKLLRPGIATAGSRVYSRKHSTGRR
jgi:hypothetical protein